MRIWMMMAAAAAALLSSSPAAAAEALRFGAAPQWVVPHPLPLTKPTSAPFAVLLQDQQIALDRGKVVTFTESAIRLQSPEGLAAGSISFSWNPATTAVTVNKLHIRRGDRVIDVLGAGQTFTVLRRETNLEAAMLDGTLTANIQPEGLQEGDIINIATTTEESDPVMKGHVEALFATWNGLPVEAARARLTWPTTLQVDQRQSAGLPAPRRDRRDGRTVVELTDRNVEPLVPPKGAPLRFSLGRFGEATDFRSWAELADLFAPLYRAASVIPASGPLRDELRRIAAAGTDPTARAEQAVALVQDRIRYVALAMGQGGYVPANAETTWARRFGDCKAKTALLLALLHELGIEAEPVLVNVRAGDAIAGRLPMVQLFDHVLVRARIGGKTYWLDGTSTADFKLDASRVPDFGWALPLVPGAALVHLVPPPQTHPDVETSIDIDATAGVYAPAPATIEQVLRDDLAIATNATLAMLSAAQRTEFFKAYVGKEFDFLTFKSATMAFDKADRRLRLLFKGDARLDWSSGAFHVPASSVGYNPDLERSGGPFQDAPVATNHPGYARNLVRIRMPPGFLGRRPLGSAAVDERLLGVEYRRTAAATGDLLTIESSTRTLVPEVAYRQATAEQPRLRALADEDVAVPLPSAYVFTAADVAARIAEKPGSFRQFIDRGVMLLDAGKFDEAIGDFTSAAAINAKSPLPLANRAIAHVWKKDWPSAAKDMAAADALDSDHPVLNRAKGLRAELQGNHKDAAEFFSKSLQREPNNTFALSHRAAAWNQIGERERALEDSARALRIEPGMVDLRVMRANILLKQGKRDAVADEARQVTADNPESDYAFVAAGKIYAGIGKTPEAMQALDKALALKPEAYVYLNRAYVRPVTDTSGRMADFDAALKLEPTSLDALTGKAEELAAAGDYKRALDLYDAAVKADPAEVGFQLHRAILLYKAGRQAEGAKLLAEQRPKFTEASAFNKSCWLKATAGILLESALLDCQEAVRLEPRNFAAVDSLGFVLLRLGKLDEAIAQYSRAIDNTGGAASYMGRAAAYARKGDKPRAQADRAKALELSPQVEALFASYGVKL